MGQAQARAGKYAVVFDGQSLNINPASPNTYPEQLMANYPHIPFVNVAVGGAGWYELVADGNGRLNPHANSGLTTILIMCGGTADYNDFGGNTTASAYYTTVSNYADAARTAGFDKVICTTTTPASYLTGTNPGNEEYERLAGNLLVLADANSKFDHTVDLESGGLLSDVNDVTYYVDEGTQKVHWTAAGALVAANLVKAKLDLLIPVEDR